MKRKHQYIRNTEMISLDDPLFRYTWNLDGGHTEFGGVYTEHDFEVYRKQNSCIFSNIRIKRMPENHLCELISHKEEWQTMMAKFHQIVDK